MIYPIAVVIVAVVVVIIILQLVFRSLQPFADMGLFPITRIMWQYQMRLYTDGMLFITAVIIVVAFKWFSVQRTMADMC